MFLHFKETDISVETKWEPWEDFKWASGQGGRKRERKRDGSIRWRLLMTKYHHIFIKLWAFRKKVVLFRKSMLYFLYKCFISANTCNINVGQQLCCSGVSQSAKGPCDGGPCHCQAGNGHSDPGCAGSDGGRTPDADSLDAKDHCGRGAHGSPAGAYFAPDRTTFQGTCTNYPGSHRISDIMEINCSSIHGLVSKGISCLPRYLFKTENNY